MAIRLDKLDAPQWMGTKFEKTPEGYLKGRAVITSTGIFEYLNSDGSIVRELRLPEEVFSPAFLDSVKMKPITMSHPSTRVTAENIKDVQIGTVGSDPSDPKSGTSDNYFLSVDMIIHDAEAVRLIENGTRALSVGYTCDLEKAEPNARWCGQKYDFIQRKLVANHLSVVAEGRQGDQAKIRFDSADMAVLYIEDNKAEEEDTMASDKDLTIKIDASEVQEVIKASNEKADGLQVQLDALTVEKSKVEAERDTFKDKIDALELKIVELEAKHLDEKAVKDAVERMLKVREIARIGEVEVKDGMSELDIQKAVIAKAFPKANLDGKDQVYINARFDGAVEAFEALADAKIRVVGAEETAKIDTTDSVKIADSNKAREQMYAKMDATLKARDSNKKQGGV